MKNLIDFFVNYKHWFVFILLEVISLVSLFSYNGYQKSVYFTTANGVVGNIYNAISSVSSYLSLKDVNQQMEQENEAMRQEIIALRKKLSDMHLDSLTIDGLSTDYRMVNAQVINNSLHRGANLITINKGEADGIRTEMGVVCANGVVGIIYMTSRHYSIVMPLISIHSKISCRIIDSEYFGSLIWKRGNPDVAYATGFPRHATLKAGELIETNGFSDIFPPGIPIGTVTKIMNSEDGMSYMLKVKLKTHFKNLREVSVITNYQAPERVRLEEKADSLNADANAPMTQKEIDEAKKEETEDAAALKKAKEKAQGKSTDTGTNTGTNTGIGTTTGTTTGTDTDIDTDTDNEL